MPAIEAQRALQPVPLPDGGYPPVNEVPFNSISMLDGTITHKIYVRDATVRRSPGGRVEVRSQVANCTDFPQQVEMRIQFYDGDRMASEPVSAWKRVFLSPRSNGAFAETSIGTRTVQYYVIEVREGR